MKTETPVVTVVMPVYNAADEVLATVASVQRQTLTRWELLAIDDGSTDSSAVGLRDLADPRIRVLTHPSGENRGQFASRVLGARHARAPVVALLDADDLWPAAYLEAMVGLWAETAPGMLASPAIYWHPSHPASDFIQPMVPPGTTPQDSGRLVQEYFESDYFKTPCPSAALVARDLLLAAEPLSEIARGNHYEDQCLWLLAAALKPVVITGCRGVRYRQAAGSFSRQIGSRGASAAPEHERRALEAVRDVLLGDATSQPSRDVLALIERRLDEGPTRIRLPMIRALARRALPPRVKQHLRRTRARVREIGSLRAVVPRRAVLSGVDALSDVWGADRGTPINRVYIEAFLERHAAAVRGRVLEFQEDLYASRFGGDEVASLDILDLEDRPQATIVADLTGDWSDLPETGIDCIICTQVLHVIDDFDRAVAGLHHMLAPGGVALISVPQTSMSSPVYGELWRFTGEGLRRVLAKWFGPENVEISVFGNSLAAAAELRGLTAEELRHDELWHEDPRFGVIVCARARRP